MATLAGFRARFPLLTSEVLADAVVGAELTAASALLGLAYWGERWTEGVYLLTAHNATLATNAASGASVGGGDVSSAKAGDVAVSYRAPVVPRNAGQDAHYYRTPYGTSFVELRSRRRMTPFVTG
jgi:hypothetical protein